MFSAEGARVCTLCPPFETTIGLAASRDDCVCEAGRIRIPGLGTCDQCPVQLVCSGANATLPGLSVHDQFWRPGHLARDDVRRCPYRQACTGGTSPNAVYDRGANSTCAPGRGLTGAYCQLCVERDAHYFDTGAQRCESCDALIGPALATLAVVLAVAAIVAAAIASRHRCAPQLQRHWLACTAILSRIGNKVRIAVSFLQIVTQIDRVYALEFPAAFYNFVRALGVVNLGPDALPGLSGLQRCLYGQLERRLLTTALVPLGIAALPFVAKIWRRELVVLPYVLGWIFLLLPSISSLGFRALAPCECFEYVDGGRACFLREDYEVECESGGVMGAPPRVLAAAWTAVGVWAIGVPLLLGAFVWSGQLASGDTGGYRPQLQWWGGVVVLQKLTLCGFLALFRPGTRSQLLVAVMIALAIFAMQLFVQPYRARSDNFFAHGTSLSLIFIFLSSVGLQSTAAFESSASLRGESLGSEELKLELATLFGFTILVLVGLSAVFVWELHQAREVLVLRSTGQPPALAPPPPKWHAFLSHNWDNQDAVATIKRQLQRLLPEARIFLDVDDLASVDALEAHVHDSAAVLILLGSERYFTSTNCLREVAAAKHKGRPLVRVHESDAQKKGASLARLEAACPAEYRTYVFDGEVIPWHRLRDFQQVSLARIAELVVAASAGAPDAGPVRELQVVGGLAWASLHFASPVSVYASPHNPQVEGVVATLQQHFPGMVLGVEHATAASAWLLFLTADCFEGDRGERLAGELQAKLERGADGCALLMVYDPMANLFGDIIDATKVHAPELLQLRPFDAFAVEWHASSLGKVSVQLVAQRLGASRWSLWELFRAKRPRATSRAPVGWSGARNVLIHQTTYRARLVELPDAQSQKAGGGEVLDLEKL